MDIVGSFIKVMLSIDIIIYNIIGGLFDLILELAEAELFTNEIISSFTSRIYVLLGIFMLFKLSFSIITYIINPDEFLDKTKGITSIGKRVIISLILIVLTPYIFYEAKQVQSYILKEHTLDNLVFGTSAGSYDVMSDSGKTLKFQLFSQFIKPNMDFEELSSDCRQIYELDADGNYVRKTDNEYSYVMNEACASALKTIFESTDNKEGYNSYINAMETQQFAYLQNDDIYVAYVKRLKDRNIGSSSTVKIRVIDYSYFLSTVAGIITALLLLTFCFDVAVRSIKLGFLQIMAPIPIISYCDPKGKDGMFKKWTTACVKTYLSLFVRLLAIYLGVSLIARVLDSPYWDKPGVGVAKAFIIIGGLMFAKQLPGIISEITGIKMDSKLYLNPFKKVGDEALGGKNLLAAGAVGGAMGAAFLTNTGAGLFSNDKKRRINALFTGGRAALSAGARGIGSIAKGEGMAKSFSSSYRGATMARKQRYDRADEGVYGYEAAIGNVQHAFGMSTAGDRVDYAKKKNEEIQSTYKSMMNAAVGNDKLGFSVDANGYYDMSKADDAAIYNRLLAAGLTSQNFNGIKNLQSYIDEVSKTSFDRSNYATEADYARAVSEHNQLLRDLEDVRDRRLNAIASGKETTQDAGTTAAITEGYKKMQTLAHEINGINDEFDITHIDEKANAKTINGMSKGVGHEYNTSDKAEHATRVNKYIKTEKK